jgi:tRNA pseudouridine65 synthase
VLISPLNFIKVLEIIYQDEHYVAINKPAGLLVHRTRIAEETKEFALQILRDQIGQKVSPLHRLDRGTSGVLIFALHSEAAGLIMKDFTDQKVRKTYYAIVRGHVKEEDTIDYALKTDKNANSKDAITKYIRLATAELNIPVGRYATARYSLVKAHPLTGRMHQIRKHFAHISHYIIGDKRHGDWRHNRMFAEQLECPRMLLHSYETTFYHPYQNKEVTIKATFPEYWYKIFETMNWDYNGLIT